MGFLFNKGHNSTNRADMIADFQINTASYGEVVPEILGTTRVSGNIIDYEDFTAHEHKSTTRTGKGGKSKHTEITYTYTVAAAIALCEGPTRNMAAYLRKIAIDGYIIQIDHADIKAMTAEIQKIGVNVNQIARRVNATGNAYQEDIEEIKGVLAEIWRLQRLYL